MRPVRFRIFRYKSISDSGWCDLASDLTVLAGKNESGKTAVLEALRDFGNGDEPFSASSMPLEGTGERKVVVHFSDLADDLAYVAEMYELHVPHAVRVELLERGLSITKYGGGMLELPHNVVAGMEEARPPELRTLAESAVAATVAVADLLRQQPWASQPELPDDIRDAAATTAEKAALALKRTKEGDAKTQIERSLQALQTQITALDNTLFPSDALRNGLAERLPKFIYFSDFSDILPYSIPLAQAATSNAVRDFAIVSGIDLKVLEQTTEPQARRNLLAGRSADLSQRFSRFWAQEALTLSTEVDGDDLRFWVREGSNPTHFKPEQRSKGFQWFYSFFLRLTAIGSGNCVLLVDEPGLFLHAKAQRDVLLVLGDLAATSAVLFATHSPYLIDAGRLDRIRLVERTCDGSVIRSGVHKGADPDALTPVLTAIGLDVAIGISPNPRPAILLEGISDYYYLLAFQAIIGTPIGDVSLVPCIGASKVPFLASLLIGWGTEFIALLDSDRAGKNASKVLRKELDVNEERIVSVGDGAQPLVVEDLFSEADFDALVRNDASGRNANERNGALVARLRLDKVALAKRFFQSALTNPPAVDQTTSKRVTRLLQALRAALESVSPS